MSRNSIITIDGLAETGKGEIAKAFAETWPDSRKVDTGSIYRSLGLRAIDVYGSVDAAAASLANMDSLTDGIVESDGVFLPAAIPADKAAVAIRSPEADQASSQIAQHEHARAIVNNLCNELGESALGRVLIFDGRAEFERCMNADQEPLFGLFVDCSAEVRADRKAKNPSEVDDILRQIEERDRRDQTRAMEPAVPYGRDRYTGLETDSLRLSPDEPLIKYRATIKAHMRRRAMQFGLETDYMSIADYLTLSEEMRSLARDAELLSD